MARYTIALELDRIHDNLYIIIAAMGISLMFFALSLILHFQQHFKCQLCCSSSSTVVKASASSNLRPRSSSVQQIAANMKDSRLRCLCGTHDDDDFDFFPMAFLIYLALILLLCFVLTARFIILYINDSWHESLIQFELPSIENLVTVSFEFKDLFSLYHTDELIITIIDYVIVYFVIFMSLLESLFNFYRYYTTVMTTEKLQLVTTTRVVKKYLLYSIIFFLLYAVVIHLYFWVFPIIILLHMAFGAYWTCTFASILIQSYTNFVGQGLSVTEANKQVMNSVYFMRKISLLCTVIQSIYLSLFMLIYYINFNLVIIYLPILWSITSFLFSLNFVRNREAVQRVCKCSNREVAQSPTPPFVHGVKTVSSEQEVLADATETKTTGTAVKQISCRSDTLPSPQQVSFRSDTVPSPQQMAFNTETPLKQVSFNVETTTHHLSLSDKKPVKQVSFNTKDIVVMTHPETSVDEAEVATKARTKARATSDSTIQIRVTGPLQPLPIDLTIMPQYKAKQPAFSAQNSHNSPKSDKDSPYTPSSASLQNLSNHKNHPMLEIGHDTMRSYIQSMELTQQGLRPEISVYTETDVGGGKLEEYNRYLATTAHAQNDPIMTTPQMHPTAPGQLERANTEMSEMALTLKEPEKKRASEKKHTLDPVQLALQLSLLKKFGFNVNRIQKSLK